MRNKFRSGDIVRIVQSGGSPGEDLYVFRRYDLNPYYCWISERGIAPNGKLYAEQRWTPNMLVHEDPRVEAVKSGKGGRARVMEGALNKTFFSR